jgi:hypothetical protein
MKKIRELLNRIWPDDRPVTAYTFVHDDDPEYIEWSEEHDDDVSSVSVPVVMPLRRRWTSHKPDRKLRRY